MRLYVLDCGIIISHQPERFGVTDADVPDPNFSDPCFLVVHPKGMLLYDTGLIDAQVGRPIYENKLGYEGQLKTATLKGELANIGVTAPMITYLAISHSHWDHVGNANDYAGSTWLARKAEHDVMFGPNANAIAAQRVFGPGAGQDPVYRRRSRCVRRRQGGAAVDAGPYAGAPVALCETGAHRRGGGLRRSLSLHGGKRLGRMPPREQSLETPASRKKVDAFMARTRFPALDRARDRLVPERGQSAWLVRLASV